jgi:hypothetical protein
LRDRTAEGQHYRVAGLNLLAAIIIYWNTLKLGEAVFARRKVGSASPAEFLAHVSPLGWEHINLTGEYRWPRTGSTGRAKSGNTQSSAPVSRQTVHGNGSLPATATVATSHGRQTTWPCGRAGVGSSDTRV